MATRNRHYELEKITFIYGISCYFAQYLKHCGGRKSISYLKQPFCCPHFCPLDSAAQGGSFIRPPPPSTTLQVTVLQNKHSGDTYFLVHPVVILIVSTWPVVQVRWSVFGAM